MDIGDIISALVVLSFVVGPIIEAMRKGGQNKPPSNQPSNQPRPSSQNRAPQKPTSAPLQPSPRTQTTPSGTTAQSKQGGWQTSNNKPANDLQARLEEARRRVQEQQARERDTRTPNQQGGRQPAQQPSQPRPQRAQPQRPQSQRPQPQRPQPSFSQAQPSFSLLGESEPATTSSLSPLSLETTTPLGSASLSRSPSKRRRRPVVHSSQKQPLLALDGNSIQRGIIWKQILDKPRYKQRLQEKPVFPHR